MDGMMLVASFHGLTNSTRTCRADMHEETPTQIETSGTLGLRSGQERVKQSVFFWPCQSARVGRIYTSAMRRMQLSDGKHSPLHLHRAAQRCCLRRSKQQALPEEVKPSVSVWGMRLFSARSSDSRSSTS